MRIDMKKIALKVYISLFEENVKRWSFLYHQEEEIRKKGLSSTNDDGVKVTAQQTDMIRDNTILPSINDTLTTLSNDIHSNVDLRLTIARNFRSSLDICDEEKEFVRDKFATYIGVDANDIPTIGFGGSGGGFRAMIATTGKHFR